MTSLQRFRPRAPSPQSSYFPPAHKNQPLSDREKQSNIKHNAFRFPLTKKILWDQSPLGPAIKLHPMHTRNIALHVSEAAVRLAHRHALQADTQPFHGFLVGSVTVDGDEEGLTISLDRFDPGRDVPGRSTRLPTARLPTDYVVPLTVLLGDADISATHSSDDFIASFKLLESSLNTHGSVDPSRRLSLRVLCRCHSNTDDVTLSLHFGAVTVATVFTGYPVNPIPLIPTALARNLLGPLSISDVQGLYKTGFLSMDETRKLLLLLESDPKTSTIPLIGIWLSGVTHISNPVVWSACLRYLNSSGIQERVCSSKGGFLVVLFTRTSRQPLFYEFMVKSEQDPKFMLVGCRENLHVFKHSSAKGKPPVEMELTPARSGPSKSLFMQSLAQHASTPARCKPGGRRRSSVTDCVSTEESQLMPRPSPKPLLEKSPSVMPAVPELSFISDSFCEPTTSRRDDYTPTDVHPKQKPSHATHRQRLHGQSDGTGQGLNKTVSVSRKRLPGTSKTPPQGPVPVSQGSKGYAGIYGSHRPGPLRALNGQELDSARRKGSQSDKVYRGGERVNQLKDTSSRTQPNYSSKYDEPQRQRASQHEHNSSHTIKQHSSHNIPNHFTKGTAREGNLSPGIHGRSDKKQTHPQIRHSGASTLDEVSVEVQPLRQMLSDQLNIHQSEHTVTPQLQQSCNSHDGSHSPPSIHPTTAQSHEHSTTPYRSHDNRVKSSVSHENKLYPDASPHQIHSVPDIANTYPQAISAANRHSTPASATPKGSQPQVQQQMQSAEGVSVHILETGSDVSSSRDKSQSRESVGVDTKTQEQLKRQEEMIQQLQEQIKLLLQAQMITQPHPSAQEVNTTQPTPDHRIHQVAQTGSHLSHPDVQSQSQPAATDAPSQCQPTTLPSSKTQPMPSPVMVCSMAVNTGQSLFWSAPDALDSPVRPSESPELQTSRPTITSTPGVAAMSGPELASTPAAPEVATMQQTAGVQEGFMNNLQKTQKLSLERMDIARAQESNERSSHSSYSSHQQQTPSHSPARSGDESSHTFGANLSSPTLGESASTYAPPHPEAFSESSSGSEYDESEDEGERKTGEEVKRANMASPSLLYRDEKKFYDNLLGQVQELLHSDDTDGPSDPPPQSAIPEEVSIETDIPRALPDMSMATKEELERLGINLHSSDITITDRSLYRSLYNVSPDLHPHINYVSLADFTFDPTDLSMEANAIAMKYLSDGELAKLSAGFHGDRTPGKRGGGAGGVNPLLRSVLTGIGGASGRGGDVDSSVGVNMSLASRKYMEKYGLISGGEVNSADSSPKMDGHFVKPSPIQFFKSPATIRTKLPKKGKSEENGGMKAKPTRLSYSPPKDVASQHSDKGEIQAQGRRDDIVASNPAFRNVLGHLNEEQDSVSVDDGDSQGNILDMSKLKQLPKLL